MLCSVTKPLLCSRDVVPNPVYHLRWLHTAFFDVSGPPLKFHVPTFLIALPQSPARACPVPRWWPLPGHMISDFIHPVSTRGCHREANSPTQEREAIENIKARIRKDSIYHTIFRWYSFLKFLPPGLCLHPTSPCLNSLNSFLSYMRFFIGPFSSIEGHICLLLINSADVDLQANVHWKKFKWLWP